MRRARTSLFSFSTPLTAVCVALLLFASFPFAFAQSTPPTAATSGPYPSAAFIAQIKAQMSVDPKMAGMSEQQLDMIARNIAIQLVRSGKAPAALVATSTSAPAQNTAQPATPQNGLANCFDYYKFGSVQAKLDANVLDAIAGSSVTFSGVLENSNPYPVVDGTLYVKIFRYPKGEFDMRNGPDVVDQFAAIDGISIPGNGSIPATFTWKIPAYAVSGEYAAAMFYTTGHKFNLLGLTFTDDVTGNTARFKVTGEQQGLIAFVKDKVAVDGSAYHFAEFPPRASTTGDITVTADVKNITNTTQAVPVHWRLYSWDAQLPGNLIAESDQIAKVIANDTTTVSYTITDASVPVYLLVGTLDWNDTKSVIGVRVVRPGINKLRINFPSAALYPLEQGKENTLFSCFHNSSDGVVQNAKLDLRLVDAKGNEIHSFSYQGAAGGNMMAVAKKFTPEKSYRTFSLEAKLYQDGALVDETTVHYDCEAIDPKSCPRTNYIYTILEILAGLALAVGYVVWRRRSNHTL